MTIFPPIFIRRKRYDVRLVADEQGRQFPIVYVELDTRCNWECVDPPPPHRKAIRKNGKTKP